MPLALVESPYALFETEEGLVDFCAVDPGLLVHVHVVGSPLVAGQVYEGNLAEEFFAVFKGDLEYGVGARGVGVGGVLRRDSFLPSLQQVLTELLARRHARFLQSDYIYVVLVVLSQLQLRPLIQQVVEPPAVDLVERQFCLQMAELRLDPPKLTLAKYSKI